MIMSQGEQFGEFLYNSDEQTLRLPHGLGTVQLDLGFCSETNWRYSFADFAKATATAEGMRLKTDQFFIPQRLGHGGVVCYHRPAYSKGLTVSEVAGTADFSRTEHGFDIVLSGETSAGIKSAFVHMEHFPQHAELLVPYFEGRSIKDIPPGTIHVFDYPNAFGWIHQFVIFQCDSVGFMIRFDDPSYSIKRLVMSTLEPEYGLQVGIYAERADGGNPQEWTSPTFKFESFRGGWEVAAKRYRDWIEFDRGLAPFESANTVPDRQRDISLIVNLRGHNWGPFIYNTFDQMCDRLKELAQYIDPRYCLAYIEGFDAGYLPLYTEFAPGAELGGADGFRKLIDCAHKLGYLIAPYLHTHCLTEAHPLYERFKDKAFTQWSTDFDGDGVCERMFWNIRADDPEWNEMQLAHIERLFASFDIDGALLDQIACLTPGQNPLEYIRCCQQFLSQLQSLMPPETFLLTEGLGEPFWETARMGMTPVHSRAYSGANQRAWDMLRPPEHVRIHPVLKYVSNYFVRPIGHSSVRAAQETAAYEYQARNYAELGIIPILNLHQAGESIADSPLHLADIARAKRIAAGMESLEYRV